MKRLMLIFAALSLSACAPLLSGLLSMGGVPASPAAVADKTVLDEKAGIAVETMYAATARAGALAFRTGVVTPSTNPAVQLDSFCPLVLANAFEPTDQGSAVMALECKLRSARDRTRDAYKALNATSYDQAAREAISIARELLALIRGS